MVGTPLHVRWRQAYREDRYARHLSRAELNKRIRDIFLNLLTLTGEAKIGLPPMEGDGGVWMEKWTHVLEEMVLRYGPYPAGFDRDTLHSEPFPDFLNKRGRRAALIVSKIQSGGPVLIKFGKREHMQALHSEGLLRLQPASFFHETGLNGAVRDDELSIGASFPLSREDVVKVVRNPQEVPAEIPEQRVDVAWRFSGDYWLYCMTTAMQPRLFVDFEADACVIVKDRDAFRKRFTAAIERDLEDVAIREGDAIYVDPLMPTSAEIDVPLAKYFGYAYQREHRFALLPTPPQQLLQYRDLCIGPLADISELVAL